MRTLIRMHTYFECTLILSTNLNECMLIGAHAFWSARLLERTLIVAHAYWSARLLELTVLFERTLTLAHSYLSARLFENKLSSLRSPSYEMTTDNFHLSRIQLTTSFS